MTADRDDVDRAFEQPLSRGWPAAAMPTPTLTAELLSSLRASSTSHLAASRRPAAAVVPRTMPAAAGSERSNEPKRPPVPDSATAIVRSLVTQGVEKHLGQGAVVVGIDVVGEAAAHFGDGFRQLGFGFARGRRRRR